MNVILDTNAFGLDLHLKSGKLLSLLDYLKIISGRIVLLDAVRIEMTAMHRRKLEELAKRVEAISRDFGLLCGYAHLPPAALDVSKEVASFEKRLIRLSEESMVVTATVPIDVREIVKRGANRIRPANANGEELRDVLIWLSALEYANSSAERTAFISGDRTFWDGEVLHPQIAADISAGNGQLTFYRSVESFLRDNNLGKTSVSANWLSSHLQTMALVPLALEQANKQLSSIFEGYDFRASLNFLNFQFGSAYEVSANTLFVEFNCFVELSIEQLPGDPPSFSDMVKNASSVPNFDIKRWANAKGFISGDIHDTVLDVERSPLPKKILGIPFFTMRLVNDVVSDITTKKVAFVEPIWSKNLEEYPHRSIVDG